MILSRQPNRKIALHRNFRPLCFVNNKLLTYKKEKFFLVDTSSFEAELVCELKIEDPRRPFCCCSFGERLSHVSAYCGIEVENGALVVYNRGIYHIDTSSKVATREFSFTIPDMRRPLNLYEIKNVKGFDDMIICPDYSYNKERIAMHLYGRDKDGQWRSVYTFPKGTIRHIHSLICDPYRDRVLVLTGDFGDECAIWEATSNFRSVVRIVGSDQKYRACCGRAFPEGVVIATDSPFNQNYVYLMEETRQSVSFNILAEIAGPVIFQTYYEDEIIFSTDVEYDESSVHGFKQYFSYKRGPGVHDWTSHVYKGNPQKGFKEILGFEKDIWPMVSLGFGKVEFPNGEISGKIIYYPTAVKKVNQQLCVFEVE